MPRRRTSVAPYSPDAALKAEIEALKKRIARLERPKMSSIQTVSDPLNLNDPQQGMLMVNAVGVHENAAPTDPVQYYHDGAMRKIPGGATPAWAAMYDNLVYGQTVFNGVSSNDLKFPYATMSENGAAYFGLSSAYDAELDTDIWTLQLKQDGLYSFTISSEWSDPSKGESVVKYFIEGTSINALKYPGETSNPFNGLYGYCSHRDEDYTSYDNWDTLSWIVPVKISTPVNLMARVILEKTFPTAGSNSTILGPRRLWVAWLGPLLHDAVFP